MFFIWRSNKKNLKLKTKEENCSNQSTHLNALYTFYGYIVKYYFYE